MSTVNQVSGGSFQDSEGAVLANGYLTFELNQDGIVNTSTLVCAGFIIKVPLDANGNIRLSPASSIWPNSVMTPSGSFYMVTAFTANGVKVWGLLTPNKF